VPDESVILSPKDPLLIVKLQDPTTIEQLLENPPAVLAELLAGWFASGNGFVAAAGCRIVQAAFKGEVFQQFATEFNYLRSKGKIPDNFKEKKYGQKSWVELLTIIDEETPDEDRLEALKAMFYSVNKINVTDGELVVNYQLFQIAKTMRSSELLLMRASYEWSKERQQPVAGNGIGVHEWVDLIGEKLGHNVRALIRKDEAALVANDLLEKMDVMNRVTEANGRLTELGLLFCRNIETYHVDSSE
jgi:hypothetical protein